MIGIGYNNCASNGCELTRFSFLRDGTLIVLDGQSLTVAGVTALLDSLAFKLIVRKWEEQEKEITSIQYEVRISGAPCRR